MKDRLPAGSRKVLVWNGESWKGLLEVPGYPAFYSNESSEKRCYHQLDDRYREWLAAQPKEQSNGE